MSSPESFYPNADPESPYTDIQGEVVTDVPGRISILTQGIVRTKDDFLKELRENSTLVTLIDDLHSHDFYVNAQGIANSVVLTVQKHKKPIIGITAAAITAGALYHEFTRRSNEDKSDQLD